MGVVLRRAGAVTNPFKPAGVCPMCAQMCLAIPPVHLKAHALHCVVYCHATHETEERFNDESDARG
jgi:hypothetical protein